jgi:hypothetical protein
MVHQLYWLLTGTANPNSNSNAVPRTVQSRSSQSIARQKTKHI